MGTAGKKLRRWEAAGWVGVGVLGPLLHFIWEWSGRHPAAAAIGAVNESVGEHMKILFWPLLALAVMEGVVFRQHYRNFVAVKAAAILSAVLLVPVLYYSYAGIWGRTLSAADIAIYYVAAAASGVLTCLLAERGKLAGQGKQVLGGVLLALTAALFLLFSFHPPAIGLFREEIACLLAK